MRKMRTSLWKLDDRCLIWQDRLATEEDHEAWLHFRRGHIRNIDEIVDSSDSAFIPCHQLASS